MIVVKVELWSAIDSSRNRELGRMYIANEGTHPDPKRGDYKVKVARKAKRFIYDGWDRIKATRTGTVKDYPRASYNIWRLVARALRETFPEEK